ncbi:MAG: hypothetical protein H6740_19525 [Alphaproteobacteria bacterium]|nr:hypothetical protein [Alphaproteobacteria bacterium]
MAPAGHRLSHFSLRRAPVRRPGTLDEWKEAIAKRRADAFELLSKFRDDHELDNLDFFLRGSLATGIRKLHEYDPKAWNNKTEKKDAGKKAANAKLEALTKALKDPNTDFSEGAGVLANPATSDADIYFEQRLLEGANSSKSEGPGLTDKQQEDLFNRLKEGGFIPKGRTFDPNKPPAFHRPPGQGTRDDDAKVLKTIAWGLEDAKAPSPLLVDPHNADTVHPSLNVYLEPKRKKEEEEEREAASAAASAALEEEFRKKETNPAAFDELFPPLSGKK